MAKSDKDLRQVAWTILSDAKQWSKFGRSQIIHEVEDKILLIRIDNKVAEVEEYCNKNSFEIQFDEIPNKDLGIPLFPDHQDREGEIYRGEKINIEIIKMIPHSGRKANNEIIINGILIEGIPNSGFDLLYYLFWLKINKPAGKDFFNSDEDLPKDHLKELLPGINFNKLGRFGYSWAQIPNPKLSNERDTQQSKINTLIKKRINIPFNIIVTSNRNHFTASEISTDKIELIPY